VWGEGVAYLGWQVTDVVHCHCGIAMWCLLLGMGDVSDGVLLRREGKVYLGTQATQVVVPALCSFRHRSSGKRRGTSISGSCCGSCLLSSVVVGVI
jgi:hypothetical protein